MKRPITLGIVLLSIGAACGAESFETDAVKLFPMLRPVPARLADTNRCFQSAPSLTISPKGRLWAAWHTGDTTEGDENGLVVVSNGDGGERRHLDTAPFREGPDGFIHVVHDRGRTTDREILHHRFKEADIRAGRLVTPGSRLRNIVNKAGPRGKQ